jgi:hypothetical protein
LPQGNSLSSVSFADSNTGYTVGDYGTIIKTTDGGTTRTDISLASGGLACVFFTAPQTGYIGGSVNQGNSSILKTTDGGISWQICSEQSQNGINGIFFTDANTGYAVGNYGAILKTDNGGGPPVGVIEIKPASGTLKLYPNPTSGNLTIETPEKGTLSVFNLNGILLLQRELTEPTTLIEVNTLPCGIYLVKLVSVKNVKVGKFIKQ